MVYVGYFLGSGNSGFNFIIYICGTNYIMISN